MRPFVACLVAVVLAGIVAPVAGADRAPTRAEFRAIARAAKHSPFTRAERGRFEAKRVRISTEGPWARASLVGKPGFKKTVQPALAVFRHTNGRWRLRDLGTDGVGCSVGMSLAVRSDLGIVCY